MKSSVMFDTEDRVNRHRSAAEVVMDGIKEQILCRQLRPGDQLPNEFDLCKLFNVSRGSLREAIKILATMGILELRQGVGTFVSAGSSTFIQDSLFFNLFLTYPNEEDITPLRRIIENDVMELIIDNFDKNQEERLCMRRSLEELAQMIQAQRPHMELVANDMQFHRYMASACKNGIIESIYRSLIEYIQHSMRESDQKQPPERIYSSHQKTVETAELARRDQITQAVDFALELWKHG